MEVCPFNFNVSLTGTSSPGRSCVQSVEKSRDVSKLKLQRQVQSPDRHVGCQGRGAHTGGQQSVRLRWVKLLVKFLASQKVAV